MEEQPHPKERPACPACGQDDRVFKVSTIYLDALAAFSSPARNTVLPELNDGEALHGPGINPLKIQAVRRLANSFAPPSGRKEVVRLLHPDLILTVSALVAVFFLIQIYNTQRAAFPIAVALLALFSLGYLLARRSILTRFNHKKAEEQQEKRRFERAVARWMRLYYCDRDEEVFDPAGATRVPLAQMEAYLLKEDERQAEK